MKTFLVADSRGKHMEKALWETPHTGHVQIHSRPGAGVANSVQSAMEDIVKFQPNLIVVMAGICDITRRDRQTKTISLRYAEIDRMVEAVMEGVRSAYKTIELKVSARVSFATVTGLDLADSNNKQIRNMNQEEYLRYAKDQKKTHPDQYKLNTAVTQLNRKITAFNQANGTPTTWTAEIVHPCLRGRHRAYYWRLSDGCHPTHNTRRRWARQIARTIEKLADN